MRAHPDWYHRHEVAVSREERGPRLRSERGKLRDGGYKRCEGCRCRLARQHANSNDHCLSCCMRLGIPVVPWESLRDSRAKELRNSIPVRRELCLARRIVEDAIRDVCERLPTFSADDVWDAIGGRDLPDKMRVGAGLQAALSDGWCVSTQERLISRRQQRGGRRVRVWISKLHRCDGR
jgi:hypothetical protein